jgi:hypothetical protein
MRVPEWLVWTSAIASVVGAVLSLGVFVAALRWRHMAEGLVLGIRLRSLAAELADIQAQLADLEGALQHRTAQLASYIALRAETHVGVLLARRGAQVPADDFADLNAVRALLLRVRQDLSGGKQAQDVTARCVAQTRRCSSLLATALGHAQSLVDASVGKEP